MRRTTCFVTSAGLVAGVFVGALSGGAAAASPVPQYFSQLAVADAREFVASPPASAIAVYDEDGNPLGAVTGEPGVTSLVAARDGTRLYAALPAQHSIAVIDPNTMRQLRRFSTGTGTCPASLTATSTAVWYIDACGPRLAALDPASGAVSAGPEVDGVQVTSSPEVPDRLFVFNYSSPGEIYEYSTQGSTVDQTPVASVETADAVIDSAFSADGSELITAIGSENTFRHYATADLAPLDGYPTPAGPLPGYPTAVAVDSARLAVGSELGRPQIGLYEGQQTPATTFDFPQAPNGTYPVVQPHGLAFAADGTRLYAVTVNLFGGPPAVLHTYRASDPPSPQPTQLVLAGPAGVAEGSSLHLTGQVIGAGSQPVPGADVTVSGAGPISADDTGRFRYSTLMTWNGDTVDRESFTVHYAGDAWHQPATQTFVTDVEHVRTSLHMSSSSATVGYGGSVTLTVQLGPTADGRTVSVFSQPVNRSRTLLRRAAVDAAGTLSVSTRLTGRTWFEADFAGDSENLPATFGTSVTVGSMLKEAVLGCGYFSKGRRVCSRSAQPTITAHLGAASPAGKCAYVTSQLYANGRWSGTKTTACLRLSRTGSATVRFAAMRERRPLLYRIRTSWRGDDANGKTTSKWQYLRLT